MKLKNVIEFGSKLIFDGEEDKYYDYLIKVDMNTFILESSVTKFKSLYKLIEVFGKQDYFEFALSIPGSKESSSFPGHFKSLSGFTLQYSIVSSNEKEYLIVISSGEFQPGRFKLFLEGVWEFN